MHLVAWVLGCTESCTHCFFVMIRNPEFSSHAHSMETLPPKKWFLQYLGEWRVCSLVVILIITILECILPEYAA